MTHTHICVIKLTHTHTQSGVALDRPLDVQYLARLKTINSNNSSRLTTAQHMAIKSKRCSCITGKLDFYHFYQHCVAASGAHFSKNHFPTDWAK